MNAIAPTLTPQIIGEVENAHLAHLALTLAPSGLTRIQWIALSVTMTGGGTADVDALVQRLVGGLKVSAEAARDAVAGLVATARLVEDGEEDGARVRATAAGEVLFAELREATTGVVANAYGGIPEADLAVAARVLTQIAGRLNEQLVARLAA
ncbi:hypothetical protein ABIA32_000427 [Streptacidiphilus sp. MAP12-20]|uniref:hypothetical protein n=1 Tax=Streptacidiphilus sp. MAP12-20 TaxID=3156299 RepID=UPI003511EFB2